MAVNNPTQVSHYHKSGDGKRKGAYPFEVLIHTNAQNAIHASGKKRETLAGFSRIATIITPCKPKKTQQQHHTWDIPQTTAKSYRLSFPEFTRPRLCNVCLLQSVLGIDLACP